MKEKALGTSAKTKAARVWNLIKPERCPECGEAATSIIDLGNKRWFLCDNCLSRWCTSLPGEEVK